jgi:hypothetical protein
MALFGAGCLIGCVFTGIDRLHFDLILPYQTEKVRHTCMEQAMAVSVIPFENVAEMLHLLGGVDRRRCASRFVVAAVPILGNYPDTTVRTANQRRKRSDD